MRGRKSRSVAKVDGKDPALGDDVPGIVESGTLDARFDEGVELEQSRSSCWLTSWSESPPGRVSDVSDLTDLEVVGRSVNGLASAILLSPSTSTRAIETGDGSSAVHTDSTNDVKSGETGESSRGWDTPARAGEMTTDDSRLHLSTFCLTTAGSFLVSLGSDNSCSSD